VNQISTQQRKFPPAMNGYFQWKLTTTFHLGPTAGEKLHVVSTHTTVLSNKPSVVFHDGLTDKDLVTSDCPWRQVGYEQARHAHPPNAPRIHTQRCL
jgi:hypothetical protein